MDCVAVLLGPTTRSIGAKRRYHWNTRRAIRRLNDENVHGHLYVHKMKTPQKTSQNPNIHKLQSCHHYIEASSTHTRQFSEHNPSRRTVQVVKVSLQRRILQEVARRLETHLHQRRSARVDTLTVERQEATSPSHDIGNEVKMTDIDGDTVTIDR